MAASLHQQHMRVVIISAALTTVIATGWYFYATVPPQMGDDERVFSAVDALFTAVTARNEKLLARCETRLELLRDDGSLTEEAFSHLESLILQAKTGEWQKAARRLYKFMEAQRREAL